MDDNFKERAVLNNITPSPIVSLIIPVYNVEPFLRKALQSAAEQTLQNIEVIMINDGSTDSSLSIMKEFEQKYSHFILIDQKNAGLSAARNVGLQLAKGEYIAFMDSDDFISPDFLQKMVDSAIKNDAEIVCCNYYIYYYKSGRRLYMPFRANTKVYSAQDAGNKLIRDITLHYFAWNKLYKRSLFIENNIVFPPMYFEDIATSPRLFYYAKKVSILSDALYYYTKRSSSILGSMNAQKVNDYVKALVITRSFLEKKQDYRTYRSSFVFYCYRCMICNVYSIFRIHILKGSFRGMGHNLRNSAKTIQGYVAKDFVPIDDFTDIPPVVVNPKK